MKQLTEHFIMVMAERSIRAKVEKVEPLTLDFG